MDFGGTASAFRTKKGKRGQEMKRHNESRARRLPARQSITSHLEGHGKGNLGRKKKNLKVHHPMPEKTRLMWGKQEVLEKEAPVLGLFTCRHRNDPRQMQKKLCILGKGQRKTTNRTPFLKKKPNWARDFFQMWTGKKK